MKKTALLLIVLIVLSIPLSAQRKRDVLYLKNGGIIYGKLIEFAGDRYKIRTADGNTLVYYATDVERMEYETTISGERKKNGPGFALEAGFLLGSQSADYRTAFSFNMIGSITSNTKNSFGLGSGVEYLGQSFLPLFFEYKYIFNEKKASPFFFVRGGKLFHLGSDAGTVEYTYPQYNYAKSYDGGATFTIGTGISWQREDGETYLSFAYRNAHTSYNQENYNKLTETYRNTYNRLEVKFGFKF